MIRILHTGDIHPNNAATFAGRLTIDAKTGQNLALIVGLMSKWPREFLFFGAIAYLTSGPLLKLWSIAFPKAATPDEAALEPIEAP